MLKFFSRLKSKERPQTRDARRLYQKLMAQSRQPVFYGQAGLEDSYDGRMEWLCLHLALTLHALRGHGVDGASLSQSLYDVMVDDFDVALREEGLSDTGVSRRIKPLAKMFFARAKAYHEAAEAGALGVTTQRHIFPVLKDQAKSGKNFAQYVDGFAANLANVDGQALSNAQFSFPKFG